MPLYYLSIHMVASSIVYIDLRMMNLPYLSPNQQLGVNLIIQFLVEPPRAVITWIKIGTPYAKKTLLLLVCPSDPLLPRLRAKLGRCISLMVIDTQFCKKRWVGDWRGTSSTKMDPPAQQAGPAGTLSYPLGPPSPSDSLGIPKYSAVCQ